ncbi:MAG: outer membrane protein transport protein [Balneolaceae bacterium]|nr:outer membrane protein transport protein [Balneolaceae bacterium]
MSKYLKIPQLLLAMALLPGLVAAQNADDALRYNLTNPSFDAASMVIPGVAYPSGLGSVVENPAALALFERSYFSFGLSNRNVSEESVFLGTDNTFDDNQLNIGDIGLVYKIPTQRGSMVLGGSFVQSNDFNRALGIDVRNNRSTLTDFYNITADDALFDAAFNVYAVDYADVDSTFTESIFRIGFAPGNWPGITQDVELTERGRMGEYSAFFATEFQKNFMIGASLGVTTGEYSYRREFLEIDTNNDYDGNFIDSDNDGIGDTDIDNILSIDTIDANIRAFRLRVGALYKFSYLNIGASYQFQSRLNVEEEFNTRLTTTFDNGEQFFDEAPGVFSYDVVHPSRLNVGIALDDLRGLTVSASAERIDYSEAEMDFGDADPGGELSENRFIESEFEEVYNLRAGLAYRINDQFTPRVGYAYYPSPRKSFDASRTFYSGGFEYKFNSQFAFNLGLQYATWEDRNRLYTFDNGISLQDEVAGEEVTRWHVMGGIRVTF